MTTDAIKSALATLDGIVFTRAEVEAAHAAGLSLASFRVSLAGELAHLRIKLEGVARALDGALDRENAATLRTLAAALA